MHRARVMGQSLGLQPWKRDSSGCGGCAGVVGWVLAPHRGPRPNLPTCASVSHVVKGALQLCVRELELGRLSRGPSVSTGFLTEEAGGQSQW